MLMFKNIHELSHAEMAVFNYVKLHLDKVPNMSIRELAERSNVSVATVDRFCKKIGYAGYTDFKHHLFDKEEEKICLDSNSAYLISFINTVRGEEYQKLLEDVSRKILNAEKLIFIAEHGSSAHINRSAASRFSSMVRHTLIIEDALYFNRMNKEHNRKLFNEDTWVIFLSRTGETPAAIDKATTLQRLGCKVLAVTASEETTLGQIADVCLPTYFRPSTTNTSYVPILFLVEELSIVASKLIQEDY